MRTEKNVPILTRVECEVMQVVWRREVGATANDVVSDFKRPIAYTTALSMLRTLEQKGYVTHEVDPNGGRAHLFRAAVPERVVKQSHVREFVSRLFQGEPNALVSGLLEEEEFSREALEELRAQIDLRLTQETHGAKKGAKK
jgi:BlaI family penicillinase repressor